MTLKDSKTYKMKDNNTDKLSSFHCSEMQPFPFFHICSLCRFFVKRYKDYGIIFSTYGKPYLHDAIVLERAKLQLYVAHLRLSESSSKIPSWALPLTCKNPSGMSY